MESGTASQQCLSVCFFMAKQGFIVVAQASKHDSLLTILVNIQVIKEKGQGNPTKEENQLGKPIG